jgi:hypothetical protein
MLSFCAAYHTEKDHHLRFPCPFQASHRSMWPVDPSRKDKKDPKKHAILVNVVTVAGIGTPKHLIYAWRETGRASRRAEYYTVVGWCREGVVVCKIEHTLTICPGPYARMLQICKTVSKSQRWKDYQTEAIQQLPRTKTTKIGQGRRHIDASPYDDTSPTHTDPRHRLVPSFYLKIWTERCYARRVHADHDLGRRGS